MLSIDDFKGEPSCSAPWYLMPSGEEIAHALIWCSGLRYETQLDASHSRSSLTSQPLAVVFKGRQPRQLGDQAFIGLFLVAPPRD